MYLRRLSSVFDLTPYFYGLAGRTLSSRVSSKRIAPKSNTSSSHSSLFTLASRLPSTRAPQQPTSQSLPRVTLFRSREISTHRLWQPRRSRVLLARRTRLFLSGARSSSFSSSSSPEERPLRFPLLLLPLRWCGQRGSSKLGSLPLPRHPRSFRSRPGRAPLEILLRHLSLPLRPERALQPEYRLRRSKRNHRSSPACRPRHP